MTGFGAGEAASEEAKISVELSSVNRKQNDVVVNLPRSLVELEPAAKKRVSEAISRGRATVSIQLEAQGGASGGLVVDDHLATEYFQAIKLLSQIWGSDLNLSPADLLRAPGVFTVRESELAPNDVQPLLEQALDGALQQLLEMQDVEGKALRADLTKRIKILRKLVSEIREAAPKVKTHYRTQLHQRLEEAGLDIALDDDRLLKEIGVFAERCDITEELTRLDSHFEQFDKYSKSKKPCGRPMDFLCQEVGREINTIGSKANDSGISQAVVEAKSELEKIREQIQNVQ
ncbi:MAG: hypothetical protein ACI8UO_000659 [Verrucomicrobiales bacterium]|jgi:uncharacterized protein (TIGR00255 family)